MHGTGVTDFGHFTLAAGSNPGAAVWLFTKQAHLAKETAGVDVSQHDFVTVLVFYQYTDRAVDDVVQHIRLVPCVNDNALVGVLAAVTMFKEPVNAWVGYAFGQRAVCFKCQWECLHALLSEILSIALEAEGCRLRCQSDSLFRDMLAPETVIGFTFLGSGKNHESTRQMG